MTGRRVPGVENECWYYVEWLLFSALLLRFLFLFLFLSPL